MLKEFYIQHWLFSKTKKIAVHMYYSDTPMYILAFTSSLKWSSLFHLLKKKVLHENSLTGNPNTTLSYCHNRLFKLQWMIYDKILDPFKDIKPKNTGHPQAVPTPFPPQLAPPRPTSPTLISGQTLSCSCASPLQCISVTNQYFQSTWVWVWLHGATFVDSPVTICVTGAQAFWADLLPTER